MLIFFCTLLIVFSPISMAKAFTFKRYEITFINKSDKPIEYFLYRVDHKIKYFSKPIHFIVGNLTPGQEWSAKTDPGIYYLEWVRSKEIIQSQEWSAKTDPGIYYLEWVRSEEIIQTVDKFTLDSDRIFEFK